MENTETEKKEYANQRGYTDIHPFEVIETRTPRKKLIRKMSAELDAAWKPEFIPGGFAGHCTNQNQQKWIYSSIEGSDIFAIRLNKRGEWKDTNGNKYDIYDFPVRFYDYNF